MPKKEKLLRVRIWGKTYPPELIGEGHVHAWTQFKPNDCDITLCRPRDLRLLNGRRLRIKTVYWEPLVADEESNDSDAPAYGVGTRVHVFSPDKEENWGCGTIREMDICAFETGEIISLHYASRIALDDGRVTEGMNCWFFTI